VANPVCIPPAVFKAEHGELPKESGKSADDIRLATKGRTEGQLRQLGNDIKVQKAMTAYLDVAENPEEALLNLLRPDRVNRAGRYAEGSTTLEFEQDAVVFKAHSELIDMMHEYKPFLGVKAITDSDPRNVVRTLMGQETTDPHASKFAQMWTKTVDNMVDRYNNAGGAIIKSGDWNLPQIHSTVKIADVEPEEWINFVYDKLDWGKMNLASADSATKRALLNDIYETLSTNGLNKEGAYAPKIAQRRKGERVLQFKGADNWLAYQDEFGNPNIYSSMMDYINGLGKDIGAMEKFGSDPEAMFRTLSDHALRTSKNPAKSVNKISHAKKVWDNTMGHVSALDTKFAHRGSAIRNWISATKLGSAIISAIADVPLTAITAGFNGMSITKPLFRMMRNLGNGADSDVISAKLMLGLEHAIDAAHTANRYSDVVGHGASARFADFVIRSSGLNHWTVSGKQAFGIEFMAHVTSKLKKGEGNKIFKLYGFDEADLALLRKGPFFTEKGVEYLDVGKLTNNRLQRKWVAMTLSETQIAVPEPDVGTRAMLNQGSRSGTWIGEAFRSATQFKSFPATIITGHLARMWNQTGGAKGRLAYGSSLVVSTTIMGTMAVIAKDFANKGEKPTMDSLTPALLFKGFVQGGSGAFVVDLLAANSKGGFGQGLTELIAGPTASVIDRMLFDIAFGEGKKLAAGKKSAGEAAMSVLTKELEQLVPNLPFVKLTIQREVLSAMHKMGDSKWQRTQRQYARKRAKETGNKYWYKP
jgi:hypothetical protein